MNRITILHDTIEYLIPRSPVMTLSRPDIAEIPGYTLDLITTDEQRVFLKLSAGHSIEMSEADAGWVEVLPWLSASYNLERDWRSVAFPVPFDTEIHRLWPL